MTYLYLQISIPNKERDLQTDTQADKQNNNLKNLDMVKIIDITFADSCPKQALSLFGMGKNISNEPLQSKLEWVL